MSLLCEALLCVHSSFAIILKKRKLVALLLLYYSCIVTINFLWLFLTVPWIGLECVIEVFPDHTHLLFAKKPYSIAIFQEGDPLPPFGSAHVRSYNVVLSSSMFSELIRSNRR